MEASDLLSAIKKDMREIDAQRVIGQKLDDGRTENTSIGSIMTRYNYDNLIEMLSLSEDSLTFEIDDNRLRDFQYRLDRHMDLHAAGDADLKKFIRGISTYLAFIAKKPLHPPGLALRGKVRVKEGGSYYCEGKKKFIKDNLSLCKYCICKAYHDK